MPVVCGKLDPMGPAIGDRQAGSVILRADNFAFNLFAFKCVGNLVAFNLFAFKLFCNMCAFNLFVATFLLSTFLLSSLFAPL